MVNKTWLGRILADLQCKAKAQTNNAFAYGTAITDRQAHFIEKALKTEGMKEKPIFSNLYKKGCWFQRGETKIEIIEIDHPINGLNWEIKFTDECAKAKAEAEVTIECWYDKHNKYWVVGTYKTLSCESLEEDECCPNQDWLNSKIEELKGKYPNAKVVKA